MNITKKVSTDLQSSGKLPVVQLAQRDQYTRTLEIEILDQGVAWEIPETARAVICYSKPDGKGGEYDTLPDGTRAWAALGNVLTVRLAPQVLTTAGVVNLTVSLVEGKEQLSSFLILLDVQRVSGGDREESEEFRYITGMLPAPEDARVGHILRVSATNERGEVVGVEAVSLYDLESADTLDEELLAATHTLGEADFIHGVWTGATDAESDLPSSTENIGDKFCTRKFRTKLVPKMSYFYFTTPAEYLFWNQGVFVGKVAWAEISASWKVGFTFDQVAVNFTWGWDYVGSEVIVRLTATVSPFQKALVLGDSISADAYGNYAKWVTELVNEGVLPASTVNDSVAATGFVAKYTAEGEYDNDFLHRIQEVEEKDSFDLVMVFGGANDYIQNIPMGQSGGDETASFVPAVDWFFSYLVDNFPKARIVVLTPLRTHHTGANTQGNYEAVYADHIREAAMRYCLPVLDLGRESGFCPFRENFKNQWTLVPDGYTEADGVHPNAEYQQKFLAPMIRDFLGRFA